METVIPTALHKCFYLNKLFQGAVNVRNILISKIGRLSNYAQADPNNIPEDIKLFEIFSGKVTQIIQV